MANCRRFYRGVDVTGVTIPFIILSPATAFRLRAVHNPEREQTMRTNHALSALLVITALLAADSARADAPGVTITGGVDMENHQFYSWKVTNNSDQPLVSIQFEQYRGDTLDCPEGWTQDWKNRAMVGGGDDAPGWVRAYVENPANGLRTRHSIEFRLRVARGDVLARPGQATVRFADGTETVVENVEVPSTQSMIERNAMVIGLAAIFIVVLVWHARRRTRLQEQTAGTAPPPAEAE